MDIENIKEIMDMELTQGNELKKRNDLLNNRITK